MACARKAISWIAVLVIASCACFWGAPFAEACTAVYVGSEVSADGSIIIARSNDNQGVFGNYIDVVERMENKPGRTMPINDAQDVLAELPATTYKYICTPLMDSGAEDNGTPHDAAAGVNECGVAMTMSITAFSNKAALDADPLVESGVTEFTMDDYVVCQSATAREAVETLLAAIDKYGSSEINIALITDQNEAWWVEMYSGHQYAAVKLPSDKVSAFGNEFQLEYLSDYEDRIVSPGLESLPKERGFAVYGDNGELNLFETYSGTSMDADYCHMRTWIGHQLLAPSAFKGDYDINRHYPACFTPDKPVSVRDVMELMRNRFEGTPYSPDETGRTDMRVIGTDTAMSVHVMQVYPQLPAEMSTVLWECAGPCIYGVFVPVSNACTKVNEAYARNQPAEEDGTFDVGHYPYYAMKGLTTFCVEKDEYKVYGTPVREYWAQAEESMAAMMGSVLAEAATMDSAQAAAHIESYCASVQGKSFDDARKLYNDVVWYHGVNSNTLKNGKNPETEEVYDELKPIDPMKVNLDPSAYAQVPDPSSSEAQKDARGLPAEGIVAVCFVALAAIAAIVFVLYKRRQRDASGRNEGE